jgi:hypothetical protein
VYKKKVFKEQEAEILLNWEDNIIEALVNINNNNNNLVYIFNIDSFTFETLPENIDLPLVYSVEQAATNAAWEAHYAKLFSMGFI